MNQDSLSQNLEYYKLETGVSRLIDRNFPSLNYNTTLKDAAHFFLEYNLFEAPVIDEMHKFIGMLSSHAILKSSLNNSLLNESILPYVIRNTPCICIDDLEEDMILFMKSQILVVSQDHTLLGLITQDKLIQYYIESLNKMEPLEKAIEWLKAYFDSVYEGIVIVDKNGIIQMYNEAYSRYVGIEKEVMVGRYIGEVVENSGLPSVLNTGIPERNYAHLLQGQEMVVHRIPIWKHDRLYGAIGMLVFEGVSELYKIFKRIQALTENTNMNKFTLEIPAPKEKIVTFDKIIGESISIVDAKKSARRAAKTSATIIITGGSGVGKELFAKAIHYSSDYRTGPLISVNCASIPENLLESELFGYAEGAFTGSKKYGKPGKFELANNGTIFLDEIGDMPLHMQPKILRVLQERVVERVGGTKAIPVNFRLIAATHRPLEDMVKEKTFREDLYYRLNVIQISVPPLRERRTDIPLLIAYLLEEICEKNGIQRKEIDKEAMVTMMNYSWPGNIRELANVIERLVILVDHPSIYLWDLPSNLTRQKLDERNKERWEESSKLQSQIKNFSQIAKESGLEKEKGLIMQVLMEVRGNKTQAAKKLGISRATLYHRLKELNIY